MATKAAVAIASIATSGAVSTEKIWKSIYL